MEASIVPWLFIAYVVLLERVQLHVSSQGPPNQTKIACRPAAPFLGP